MTAAATRAYLDGVLIEEGFPLERVADILERDGVVVWVDFCRPSLEDLALLPEEFGLHDLAVEDAVSDHQRPRIVYYSEHEFLSFHSLRLDIGTGRLATTEIDVFANRRWMITVRKSADLSLDRVVARWDATPSLGRHGVSFLLYTLLDEIVDGYFEVVAAFDEYYDSVTDTLFAETTLDLHQQREWFTMRRALVHFHRLAVPVRELVGSLMRRETTPADEAMRPYYQDVYDHILRVTESTESLRDLATTIVETNLSLRDYRQNLIMKKVTSWAAIIAVPTLVTGFYGMNVPYPGFARHSGALVAVLVMVVLSSALFLAFRRRDWL